MIRKTSLRILKECLENLKEIKRQKSYLREHYSRKMLKECRTRNNSALKRYIESDYNAECNDFVDDCREELAQCCQLPELQDCWKGVCDRRGCVYDDCTEDEFDCAVDEAIETLCYLIVPVRLKRTECC